jgi:hypothetical protein
VRFDYYERLSAEDRRIYRKSDAITQVPLAQPARHRPAVLALQRALAAERRREVERAAGELVRELTSSLGAPPLEVCVLAMRPKLREGELHGLYTLEADGRARIELWMRTANKRRVVAFRTFLRTLLHELCHHLDLTLFSLGETFHTEGFFRRESSLARQLLPEPERAARRKCPQQLSLFPAS